MHYVNQYNCMNINLETHVYASKMFFIDIVFPWTDMSHFHWFENGI